MFTSKKSSLFETGTTASTSGNQFLTQGRKKSVSTNALGNGALKVTTTDNDFVDQFGKITNYRQPRTFQEVDRDMRLLWSQNRLNTMKLSFFIRLITRKVDLPTGQSTETTQRGQGLKHEGISRMLWVAINHPEVFWKNAHIFVAIGSWKDVIQMLSMDLQYHGWEKRQLDWTKFGQLIFAGLENPRTSELLKKYLPQIKANSACKTLEAQADNMIAKWVCSLFFGSKESSFNYKQYRKLKSSGTAHQWQQLISQKKMLNINFATIHGRALSLLVSGEFLKRNNLESAYEKWIAARPVAKYTGYPYELLAPVKQGYSNNTKLKKYQIDTINAQFMQLVQVGQAGGNTETNMIVVGDTSSSMTSNVPGLKVSSYDVMKSLALYFSYFLKGTFANSWLEFNTNVTLHHWKGATPVEKLQNDRSESYGSTNFIGVAQFFADLKKKRGVPESDFPVGIICLSDGCFNVGTSSKVSNTKQFIQILTAAGFSKEFVDNFKIVLWDIPNSYYGKSQTAFEDFADAPNLFYMSGLDGATVSFVLGGTTKDKPAPKNAKELFEAAMDQEVLNLIEI